MAELSVTRLYDKSRLPPPLPKWASASPLLPDRLQKKEAAPEIKIVDLTELERYLLGMKLSSMMPRYTVSDYYSALITHIVVKSKVPAELQDQLIDRVVADSGCGMNPAALIERHLRRMLPPPEKAREPEHVMIEPEAQGPADDKLHQLLIVARPDLGTINHTLLTCFCAGQLGINISGIIINNYPEIPGIAEESAPHLIASFTGVPVLGILPHLHGSEREIVTMLAEQLSREAATGLFLREIGVL